MFSFLPIDISETIEYQSLHIPVKEVVLEPKEEENCSCVQYARQFLDVPRGDAKDLKPNSKPIVGGAILFSYSSDDHIAIIKDVVDDGWIVTEANFKRCKITERKVLFNDKFIRGFYY